MALFPIWSMMFSIARRVFLVLVRASNVSLERSLGSALLLMSASSHSCFTNTLRKKANSLRGSGLCAITLWSELFP